MKKQMEVPKDNKGIESVDIDVCFDEIIKKITAVGFTVKVENNNSVIFTNGILRVGAFAENFPHNDWKGKILADHEENFDKWSKHFYSCTFPKREHEFEILVSDLHHIQYFNNQKSSNSFGNLFRSF